MMMIEALLSLPQDGEPAAATPDVAVALTGSPTKFVRHDSALWSLTDEGRRLLLQFRHSDSALITRVNVQLAYENNSPVFHLLCDDWLLLKAQRSHLHRTLRDLQAAYPGMKVSFDFRPPARTEAAKKRNRLD